jgi:hypothetical protein
MLVLAKVMVSVIAHQRKEIILQIKRKKKNQSCPSIGGERENTTVSVLARTVEIFNHPPKMLCQMDSIVLSNSFLVSLFFHVHISFYYDYEIILSYKEFSFHEGA